MKRRVTSVQKKGYIDVGDQESGPKWTVQKGESGRSLKWTVARKWTICPKMDGLELNWTVI